MTKQISRNYKETFVDAVNDLIAQNIADRQERMLAVQALTDAYVDSTGGRPDPAQLERLTDYILREELTDIDEHKSAHNEYPILSEYQIARRRDGKHTRKDGGNMNGESPLSHAEEYGTDGHNHRTPRRRIRSTDELLFVDKHAKIRNRERSEQYRKDTAPGAVATYNLRDTGGALAAKFIASRTINYRVVPAWYR